MLRYFGAENVRVLNGGLKKWVMDGREIYRGPYEDGEGLEAEGDYDYKIEDPMQAVTDIDKVHEVAYYLANDATDWQITDARAPARFNGEVKEPRPGLRSGHITGSINVPF